MTDIDARLRKDCMILGRMPLCHLLLMLDANYPWFVLVPDREGVCEIYELCETDQQQLLLESVRLGRAMMRAFRGDKLNVAALGNVVPQLHIHHVVRYRGDPAWPAPVWGRVPVKQYERQRQKKVIRLITQELEGEIDLQV